MKCTNLALTPSPSVLSRCLVRCLDPNTCGGNLRVIWVAKPSGNPRSASRSQAWLRRFYASGSPRIKKRRSSLREGFANERERRIDSEVSSELCASREVPSRLCAELDALITEVPSRSSASRQDNDKTEGSQSRRRGRGEGEGFRLVSYPDSATLDCIFTFAGGLSSDRIELQ